MMRATRAVNWRYYMYGHLIASSVLFG